MVLEALHVPFRASPSPAGQNRGVIALVSLDLAQQAGSLPAAKEGDGQKREILRIEGTEHFYFSDYSVMFAPVLRLLGVLGPIDGRRGLEITESHVREFFDHHLSGQPAPLLTGPSPGYPEVTGRFEAGP